MVEQNGGFDVSSGDGTALSGLRHIFGLKTKPLGYRCILMLALFCHQLVFTCSIASTPSLPDSMDVGVVSNGHLDPFCPDETIEHCLIHENGQ